MIHEHHSHPVRIGLANLVHGGEEDIARIGLGASVVSRYPSSDEIVVVPTPQLAREVLLPQARAWQGDAANSPLTARRQQIDATSGLDYRFKGSAMHLVTIIYIVLLLTACGAKPPTQPARPLVGVVTARPAEGLIAAVHHVGTLAGDAEVDLAFNISGRILTIGPEAGRDWREGDTVEAGAVLARLDPTELTESMRAAEARASNDAALHARSVVLMDSQAISQQELDRLATTRDASAADLRRIQAALAEAVIRAPMAGTVLRRGARSDEIVAAGHMVLRIADLSHMSLEVGVPDQLVGRLRPGQTLPLSIQAFPGQVFAGTISEVGAAAAVSSRLFRVRIGVANPVGQLRPGMSAVVAIPGEAPPPGSITVPLSALLADADGRQFSLLVAQDGIARMRRVTVIDVITNQVVVGSGLAAGESVIAVGAGLCADGQEITTRPYDPEALYRRP